MKSSNRPKHQQHKMQKGFNFLAPFYLPLRRMVYGKKLLHCQTYFLTELAHHSTHLVAGDGNGDLTLALLQLNPNAQIWFVDISDKMIQSAKQRVASLFPAHVQQVHFIPSDIATFSSDQRFDVIHFPFLLDLFPDENIQLIFEQIKRNTLPQTILHLIDFHQNPEGIIQKMHVKLLYTLFGIIAGIQRNHLPDYEGQLAIAGWRLQSKERHKAGTFSALLKQDTSQHQ